MPSGKLYQPTRTPPLDNLGRRTVPLADRPLLRNLLVTNGAIAKQPAKCRPPPTSDSVNVILRTPCQSATAYRTNSNVLYSAGYSYKNIFNVLSERSSKPRRSYTSLVRQLFLTLSYNTTVYFDRKTENYC